jgi:uncharacterized protein (TIGR02246 family)
MAIRLKARSKVGVAGARGSIRTVEALQAAEKIPFIVIPNEVRNSPVPKTQETRASSARSVPRNDTVARFSATCFAIALTVFVQLPACRAQDSPKAADTDSAAIKQAFADFYESFSHHDAHATAMTFAEDADFTNMRGVHRRGRTDIEEWFASLFKGNLKSSNRTDTVRSIRFFTPQMATVDADTVITGTKAADGSDVPPRKGLMIVTMTKQNGRWLISVFHEAEFPAPSPTGTNGSTNRPAN